MPRFAGNCPKRQPGRAVIQQLATAEFDNFRLDLFPRIPAFAHAASLTQPRSPL